MSFGKTQREQFFPEKDAIKTVGASEFYQHNEVDFKKILSDPVDFNPEKIGLRIASCMSPERIPSHRRKKEKKNEREDRQGGKDALKRELDYLKFLSEPADCRTQRIKQNEKPLQRKKNNSPNKQGNQHTELVIGKALELAFTKRWAMSQSIDANTLRGPASNFGQATNTLTTPFQTPLFKSESHNKAYPGGTRGLLAMAKRSALYHYFEQHKQSVRKGQKLRHSNKVFASPNQESFSDHSAASATPRVCRVVCVEKQMEVAAKAYHLFLQRRCARCFRAWKELAAELHQDFENKALGQLMYGFAKLGLRGLVEMWTSKAKTRILNDWADMVWEKKQCAVFFRHLKRRQYFLRRHHNLLLAYSRARVVHELITFPRKGFAALKEILAQAKRRQQRIENRLVLMTEWNRKIACLYQRRAVNWFRRWRRLRKSQRILCQKFDRAKSSQNKMQLKKAFQCLKGRVLKGQEERAAKLKVAGFLTRDLVKRRLQTWSHRCREHKLNHGAECSSISKAEFHFYSIHSRFFLRHWNVIAADGARLKEGVTFWTERRCKEAVHVWAKLASRTRAVRAWRNKPDVRLCKALKQLFAATQLSGHLNRSYACAEKFHTDKETLKAMQKWIQHATSKLRHKNEMQALKAVAHHTFCVLFLKRAIESLKVNKRCEDNLRLTKTYVDSFYKFRMNLRFIKRLSSFSFRSRNLAPAFHYFVAWTRMRKRAADQSFQGCVEKQANWNACVRFFDRLEAFRERSRLQYKMINIGNQRLRAKSLKQVMAVLQFNKRKRWQPQPQMMQIHAHAFIRFKWILNKSLLLRDRYKTAAAHFHKASVNKSLYHWKSRVLASKERSTVHWKAETYDSKKRVCHGIKQWAAWMSVQSTLKATIQSRVFQHKRGNYIPSQNSSQEHDVFSSKVAFFFALRILKKFKLYCKMRKVQKEMVKIGVNHTIRQALKNWVFFTQKITSSKALLTQAAQFNSELSELMRLKAWANWSNKTRVRRIFIQAHQKLFTYRNSHHQKIAQVTRKREMTGEARQESIDLASFSQKNREHRKQTIYAELLRMEIEEYMQDWHDNNESQHFESSVTSNKSENSTVLMTKSKEEETEKRAELEHLRKRKLETYFPQSGTITLMRAGPVTPKYQLRGCEWVAAAFCNQRAMWNCLEQWLDHLKQCRRVVASSQTADTYYAQKRKIQGNRQWASTTAIFKWYRNTEQYMEKYGQNKVLKRSFMKWTGILYWLSPSCRIGLAHWQKQRLYFGLRQFKMILHRKRTLESVMLRFYRRSFKYVFKYWSWMAKVKTRQQEMLRVCIQDLTFWMATHRANLLLWDDFRTQLMCQRRQGMLQEAKTLRNWATTVIQRTFRAHRYQKAMCFLSVWLWKHLLPKIRGMRMKKERLREKDENEMVLRVLQLSNFNEKLKRYIHTKDGAKDFMLFLEEIKDQIKGRSGFLFTNKKKRGLAILTCHVEQELKRIAISNFRHARPPPYHCLSCNKVFLFESPWRLHLNQKGCRQDELSNYGDLEKALHSNFIEICFTTLGLATYLKHNESP